MAAIRTALIVFAHPDPRSYTAALKDVAVRALKAQGVTVVVSDLYAMGFEAAAGPADVGTRLSPDHFNLALEQANALAAGQLSADIVAEQRKLQDADLVIFHYPMWWFGFPAILKGWVDRVLSYKFAYGVGQWWDKGLLGGKKAMLAITTGTPRGAYATDGRNGDIERILWSTEAGVLAMCGFEVLPAFIAYGAPYIGDEGRAAQMAAYEALIAGIDAVPAKAFHGVADFGDDMRLRPDVAPRTAGQHRGEP